MLNWFLNLFTGGLLSKVTEGLLQAQKNNLQAQNEKSAQDLKFWESRMDLAIAAAQYDKWWSPRNLMGWTAAIYFIKIVLIDTVLKLDVTPDPGSQVKFFVITVVGFYFASKAAETIADKIASVLRK